LKRVGLDFRRFTHPSVHQILVPDIADKFNTDQQT